MAAVAAGRWVARVVLVVEERRLQYLAAEAAVVAPGAVALAVADRR
jgi:hypothetical protein